MYVCMPFSLHNAAQTSQRFIDHVLQDLPFAMLTLMTSLLLAPIQKNIKSTYSTADVQVYKNT